MTKLHPLVVKAFEQANIDVVSLTQHGRYVSDGQIKYFVKTSHNVPQLKGEHASLTALTLTAPAGFVPRSFSVAISEDGKEGGMVSEYFEMGGVKDQAELGRRLALLHRVPDSGNADGPEANEEGKYGFDVPTHCGVTEQDNTWTESWKEFFVRRRAGDIVRRLGDERVTQLWAEMQER